MELVGLLLWLLSGAGLVASVVLHINSYLALFGLAQELQILLEIGIFIVGLPLMGLLRVRRGIGSGFVWRMLKRYPPWMLVVWVLGYVYIFLDFIVIMAFLNPGEPFITVRLVTGHSMGFYGLFFMLSSKLMSGDFPYLDT